MRIRDIWQHLGTLKLISDSIWKIVIVTRQTDRQHDYFIIILTGVIRKYERDHLSNIKCVFLRCDVLKMYVCELWVSLFL